MKLIKSSQIMTVFSILSMIVAIMLFIPILSVKGTFYKIILGILSTGFYGLAVIVAYLAGIESKKAKIREETTKSVLTTSDLNEIDKANEEKGLK